MSTCSPRRDSQMSSTVPTKSAGVMIVANTMGSSTMSYVPGTGISAGLCTTSTSSPRITRNSTFGAVAISSRSNSRSRRSFTMSMWSSPEEPAPEPEAEGHRRLGLVLQGGVGELQAIQRLPQLGVVAALGREQPRPDHGLGLAVAREGFGRTAFAGERDRVADLRLVHLPQPGHQVADLPRSEHVDRRGLGRHDPGLLGLRLDARRHQADPLARGQRAVLHADVGDDPAVRVEHRVEDQRAERCVGVAHRRRDLGDDRGEQLLHARARLRRDPQDVVGVAVQQVGELLRALIRLGGRQVDLVQGGHDDQAGVARQVEVRQGLRLDPLRGVDEQNGSLAGLQGPRHLVREVHVTGRVDQVQLEALVQQPDGLGLDRDARARAPGPSCPGTGRACRGPRRCGSAPAGGRPAWTCRGRCAPRCRSCGCGRCPSRGLHGTGRQASDLRRRHVPRLLVASDTHGEHQVPDQTQ